MKRLLLVAAIILLPSGIGTGCYYHDHAVQKAAMAKIKSLGRGARAGGWPLGPRWLVNRLKKWDLPVLTTEVFVTMPRQAGDPELAHLKTLRRLRALNLRRTQVTDAGLAQLRSHTSLQRLILGRTKVSDLGLMLLSKMPQLRRLVLSSTAMTDVGLGSIKGGDS